MADIRCPNCGKNNPDFFDNCQFCQAPLKSESMLHIGDHPTKKNTGELENVLPDWLKDVRQQARSSAEEDAAQAASKPKPQKEEPLDLLAGLAFQSENADEEEVPDWLSNLSDKGKEQKKPAPPTSTAPEKDFFAQFNKSEPAPQAEPAQEETPSFLSDQAQEPPAQDELSSWFTKAAEEPVEPFTVEPDLSQIASGWGMDTNIPATPAPELSAPKEEEDLSWLRNLEEEAKKTGELGGPKKDEDWLADFGASSTPAPSSGQEDLSWLNNLGALPTTKEPAQQPFESNDDLSWLNNLGGTPVSNEPVQPPAESKDDLSWLDNLGGTSFPEQPAQPSQSQEDLSWLNAFSETPQPSQPSSAPPASQEDLSPLNQPTASSQPSTGDDLSWLNGLQGSADSLSATPFVEQPLGQDQPQNVDEQPDTSHVAPFVPRRTTPLNPEEEPSIPDWLKSATETPSMPLGADALDQFREDYKIPTGPEEPFSWKNFVPEAKLDDEQPHPPKPEPVAIDSNLPTPATDSTTLSNQDVDSLFSVDMPDWLSQPAPKEEVETSQEEIGIHAEGGEALSPADLPSWVQAMRPVEAVLSETASVEDQPTEREGPLAGFRGVIPVAPIGSARRPHPIPLKLQVTDEQQTSAGILEQILTSETSPRALPSALTFTSQRMLRIAIAVLLWLALSAVILLRTQIMPVSPILPPDVDAASKTIESIADNSPVLVVLDYEPSLAGEMEAASGPLLERLVSMHHPVLSFVTTSPNGSGLVERLLRDTNINTPTGLGYSAGTNYFNLGYLPGGEAGVLSFIQSPQSVIPTSTVPGFSDYKAIVMLTDHADSARAWIEQLQTLKQADPTMANQPLLVIASAQAGPMLQPYAGSGQIKGLINGIADAARLEYANSDHPGIVRSYWDAFGVGVMLTVALIVLGSLWSLFAAIRTRRAEAREV